MAAESDPTGNVCRTGLKLAVFDIDATPPVGSYLAYDRMTNTWDLGLRARGIVLIGAGQPIVLCSIDWIGIAGESQDAFKHALAEAARTIPERVAIHTVHQHDAPRSDFGAERLLKEAGITSSKFDETFTREFIVRLTAAVTGSLAASVPFTHVGLGEAPVYQVASNRRIPGPDGKVRATRYTTCKDPALRAEPEGLIDPMVSLVSFWNGDKPVAVLSYYATHPQSYYRTGIPNPDFPGIARFYRQLAVPQALHIHFNGAGGNIGAGKYNDGSKENRGILGERLADGMKRAWEATKRQPVTSSEVSWNIEPVFLPPAKHIELLETSPDLKKETFLEKNASDLVWLQRCRKGIKLNVGCLAIGSARILHMPGELFVEYQLNAKACRKDLFVAMATYGDYGMGYICTAKAYEEGGYEAGVASSVSPVTEEILMTAIRKLLNK
ncbi:MAG: hypothetical protein A2283_21485 [Lentisphaerae bacterium RIFOXYA12_FULL_48_11]|nr:MAG: hypothetical protein A2283_21485 [Lentisphaerae bacterium RIFOXYA12_FULL_48_11]